jgi:hypothetical protein
VSDNEETKNNLDEPSSKKHAKKKDKKKMSDDDASCEQSGSSWNSCANLEIKIDSIMNQNYRTQLNVFPLKKGIEWAQGQEQLNNIKYYNKLPYKVYMKPPMDFE